MKGENSNDKKKQTGYHKELERRFGYGSATLIPETLWYLMRCFKKRVASMGNILGILKVSVTQEVGCKASSIDTRYLYVQFKVRPQGLVMH